MVFPELFNSTNQSIEQVVNLTMNYPVAASPDVVYLASAIVILGLFTLFLYMAETRKDVGFGIFMALLAGMSFGDPLLSSIKYPFYADFQPSLPFLLMIIGGYETLMTLLLVNELRRRKAEEQSIDPKNYE